MKKIFPISLIIAALCYVLLPYTPHTVHKGMCALLDKTQICRQANQSRDEQPTKEAEEEEEGVSKTDNAADDEDSVPGGKVEFQKYFDIHNLTLTLPLAPVIYGHAWGDRFHNKVSSHFLEVISPPPEC